MAYRRFAAGAAFLALAAAGATAQGTGGGTATYWMSAETSSGMAAMAGSGGTGAGAIMRALTGGGAGAGFVRNLNLQLGTGRRPAGAPSAEHVPPAGLQAGASLPLVSREVPRPVGPSAPWQGQVQQPRGRMLIYWGCGERARAGQPVVIDFASLAAGQVPAAFANSGLKPMIPPSPSTSATYGEWPNERSQTRVPAGGSLVGEHVVRGNYTPEIRFALAPGQDFLAPVALTSNDAAASGAVPVAWRPVPGARAWFLSTMGSAQNGDFVMWSSSESQMAAMAMDYLPEADIARLLGQRALLPATAASCTVPAEVARAAPQSMLSVAAFGGEANFSHPARPARAAASWRPEWIVKLRTKSTHMGMLGMDMSEMMDGRNAPDGAPQGSGKKKKKSKLLKGLDRVLGQ